MQFPGRNLKFSGKLHNCFKLLLAVLFLFPILMILFKSFQWDNRLSLLQYFSLLRPRSVFWIFFRNSIILTVPVVILQLVIALPAAYAFARLRGKAVHKIFYLYIVTMMMPYIVTMVPHYLIADKLGLLGGFSAVILPGAFGTFGVFLLKQTIQTIPSAVYDEAEMEGASQRQILIYIVLPLAKSGIFALVLLLFADQWNSIEPPLILLQGAKKFPLSVFMDGDINAISENLYAAALITLMIPLAVFFLLQKHLKNGMGTFMSK